MTTLVLIFGLLNLAIGLGLAVAIDHPQALAQSLFGWRGALRSIHWPRRKSKTESEDVRQAPLAAPSEPPVGAMPSHWRDDCVPSGLAAATFDEAMLWLVLSELSAYRQPLIDCDAVCRQDGEPDLPFGNLRHVSQGWQQKLASWISEASGCCTRRASDPLRIALDEMLLNHTYQVKSAIESLDPIESSAHGPAARQAVSREIQRLFGAVNALRDQARELLVRIFREQRRLQSLPSSILKDGPSDTLSRFGIELTWDEWLSKDAERTRIVSVVLMDIDRTSSLNDRLGLESADKTLAAFGRMLNTLVRQHRGYDRVARFSGQSFLVFMGDTAVMNAISGAERIRQTIEVTSFQVGGQVVECTASCGAVELGLTESIEAFVARTRHVVAEAKNAGRNRTCFENGNGAQVAEVQQYLVRANVLDVEGPPPTTA